MNEAKVPDKNDWQYVDIYVFSNGQQATPPRKYHLSVGELNNWGNTLKNMAKLQYEQIFPSIDLYTVDGEPVHTPMQVAQGAAYVAVPPHDTFITAGYNDYLLKASKSRERRKSRNLSIVDRPLEMDKEKRINQIDKYEQDLKILEEEKEITTKLTNLVLEPQNSIPNKTKDIKQPERSQSIINRPVAAKNSSTHPQVLRRTSMKSKDTISKKNLKVNTSNGIMSKTNGFNNLNRSKTKTITKTNKLIDKEVGAIPVALSIIDENVQTSSSNLFKVSSTIKEDKIIVTDRSVLENAIDDKELIVVKYPDSEMTTLLLERDRSASYKHTILSSTDPVGHVITIVDDNSKSEEETDEQNANDPPMKDNIHIAELIRNKIEEDNKVPFCKDKDKSKVYCQISVLPNADANDKMKPMNKQTTDSFVALVDRREVFNLNLKIELRKCNGFSNEQCNKNPSKLHCLTEKCSQANSDADGLHNCANKHSKPAAEAKDSKIVVVHCTCCNNHNLNNIINNIETSAVKLEDKNYVLLLPSSQFDKNDMSDIGHEKPESSEIPYPDRSSAENPIKKVYAYHLLDTLVETSELKRVTSSKIEIVRAKENKEPNRESVVSKRVSIPILVSKSSKNLMPSNSQHQVNKETQDTDSLTRRTITKSYADIDTQTDWCCILLEARRNENGFYSFHLPPLHVLKHYGF